VLPEEDGPDIWREMPAIVTNSKSTYYGWCSLPLKRAALVALMTGFHWPPASAQAPAPSTPPPRIPLAGEFPGRKAPATTIEQAIDVARKAIAKQGTKLGNRYLARAEYVASAALIPDEVKRDFSEGPYWLLTYLDPEYDTEYPVRGIRVMVFSGNRVAILVP
jgi:hypothetical protein